MHSFCLSLHGMSMYISLEHDLNGRLYYCCLVSVFQSVSMSGGVDVVTVCFCMCLRCAVCCGCVYFSCETLSCAVHVSCLFYPSKQSGIRLSKVSLLLSNR